MDITRTFYDSLASRYDKLFLDWEEAKRRAAANNARKISPDSVKITYGSFTASRRKVDIFWN